MPPQFTLLDLHFPKAGIDRAFGFAKQPNRPAADGVWSRTTPTGTNVRVYTPGDVRSRGGARAGLSKYLAAQVAGTRFVVQQLDCLVTTGESSVQFSAQGRVVSIVAVSQGNVYTTTPGGAVWSAAVNDTGETPPLNYSGILYSAANQQKLWFADGINWCYFNPATNTVQRWTASHGQLPVDESNNAPRLICTWRGRTILSGLLKDPQNWFMSAVDDPTDFDYAQGPPLPGTTERAVSPKMAVAGNLSAAGLIGDVVNTLIPYSDDVLIFGGDHTIHLMRGDPMAGGQVDLVTDAIGMAWGIPWCKDPQGTVWFFSNRGGIFTLVPGQQPIRVSQQIESLVQDVNTGEYGIRLLWDDRFQGVHVFVTKLTETAVCDHFFHEARSGAWWQDRYANNDHNPLCCVVVDGNRPEDRTPILGGWDGYVRKIDESATDDDGTTIASEVWIGPMLTKDMDDMLLDQLQGVLGESSGNVTVSIHVGNTAEAAFGSTAISVGTLAAGRSLTFPIRRSGHAIYVKLTSTSAWAMEQIRIRLGTRGKVRARGR